MFVSQNQNQQYANIHNSPASCLPPLPPLQPSPAEKTNGVTKNRKMEKRGEGSRAWMPYQDHSAPSQLPPDHDKPWMVWLIPTFAVANIVFFAYSMYANDCPARHPPGDVCIFFSFLGRCSFEPLSINPLLGPVPAILDALGALDYNKILRGEVWRIISCIWLHGGVIHLLVNMLSLLFIGIRLEQEYGFGKVGTLYIISGIGGSLTSVLSLETKISVGASGALFGLLGAMLSELIINWTLYANKCAAFLSLLVVIAINMAVGMVPHVDSSAHIGGFISGFLLGFILLMRPQFGWVNQKHFPPGYDISYIKPKHKVYQYVLWILAFVMLVIWFMNNLIQLFGHHLRS